MDITMWIDVDHHNETASVEYLGFSEEEWQSLSLKEKYEAVEEYMKTYITIGFSEGA